jgi:hypothetical protein
MLNRRTTTPRRRHVGANVVMLRQRLLAQHRSVLFRWLQAGRCMGLCDASVSAAGPGGTEPEYVLVWVRENPDPAYMISPEGMRWRVTDCIRGSVLARHASFEAALHSIRPVLKLHEAA